jgi:hypothetical protein
MFRSYHIFIHEIRAYWVLKLIGHDKCGSAWANSVEKSHWRTDSTFQTSQCLILKLKLLNKHGKNFIFTQILTSISEKLRGIVRKSD